MYIFKCIYIYIFIVHICKYIYIYVCVNVNATANVNVYMEGVETGSHTYINYKWQFSMAMINYHRVYLARRIHHVPGIPGFPALVPRLVEVRILRGLPLRGP